MIERFIKKFSALKPLSVLIQTKRELNDWFKFNNSNEKHQHAHA